MSDFCGIEELELAEHYAWFNDMPYQDEESVSQDFDENVLPLVIEQYGEDDTIAISQAFNDWTDSLCKDDLLHSSQYNSYTYVGKHGDD